jgi:hypothetical protein
MIQFKNKNQSQEENFKEWISLTTKTRKDFDNDSNYYFHMLNIITPVVGFKAGRKYIEHFELYDEHSKIFERLCSKFDLDENYLIQERLFYVCMDRISSDHLKYYKGKSTKVRYIQKNELVFVLKTVCSAIYNNLQKDIPTKLAYKYFLMDKEGASFLKSFKKKIGRSIDSNKLAHIFKVLEKYELIHREPDDKGRSVFYVGKQNPLYILQAFKDIEESNDIELPIDFKKNIELTAQLKEAEEKIKFFEETIANMQKTNISNKPVDKPHRLENNLTDLTSEKGKESIYRSDAVSGEEFFSEAVDDLFRMTG